MNSLPHVPPTVEQSADEHPHTQGDEGDKALGSRSDVVRGPFIDIELAGKEKEIIANKRVTNINGIINFFGTRGSFL